MKIETHSVIIRNSLKVKGTAIKRRSSVFGASTFDTDNISTEGFLNLNSLFRLQENIANNETIQKAETLLGILDNIRREMLLGAVSNEDLEKIEILAKNLHKSTQDHQLKEILIEIEIRAVVELAKREMGA